MQTAVCGLVVDLNRTGNTSDMIHHSTLKIKQAYSADASTSLVSGFHTLVVREVGLSEKTQRKQTSERATALPNDSPH